MCAYVTCAINFQKKYRGAQARGLIIVGVAFVIVFVVVVVFWDTSMLLHACAFAYII